ncbi:hypothetical protein [Roseateles terrae]|uniref:Uncharacterized protein (UPF0332 family) n=1 Tax=Roseateles terrae TaxID=431060 RepID=A0ABR6GWM4_9BURK|nr:hypothetical protein [Roseateles terrae]MBB3196508.1 uncharacterized protein (UPF0332 family) [Roseateles terrae]
MPPFRPAAFARLADLLSRQSDEASHRSAMSRAYYATFLVTRDLLNIRDRSADVHGRACQELKTMGLEDLAEDLEELRRLRNVADYNTAIHFRQREALQGVRTAHDLLQELRSPSTLRRIRSHLRRSLLKAPAAPSSPARSRRAPRGTARR